MSEDQNPLGHGDQPPQPPEQPPPVPAQPPVPQQPPQQYAHPYGQQPVQMQQQKTNGMAIASLVLGILFICGICAILALVFGLVSLNQINKSQGTQSGRGMAIAGIVLGSIGIVLGIIVAATGNVHFSSHTS